MWTEALLLRFEKRLLHTAWPRPLALLPREATRAPQVISVPCPEGEEGQEGGEEASKETIVAEEEDQCNSLRAKESEEGRIECDFSNNYVYKGPEVCYNISTNYENKETNYTNDESLLFESRAEVRNLVNELAKSEIKINEDET